MPPIEERRVCQLDSFVTTMATVGSNGFEVKWKLKVFLVLFKDFLFSVYLTHVFVQVVHTSNQQFPGYLNDYRIVSVKFSIFGPLNFKLVSFTDVQLLW